MYIHLRIFTNLSDFHDTWYEYHETKKARISKFHATGQNCYCMNLQSCRLTNTTECRDATTFWAIIKKKKKELKRPSLVNLTQKRGNGDKLNSSFKFACYKSA